MKQKSNYQKFLLLWAGELISAVGGGLTSFGLGVYVFAQTGSAANMALISLLAFLPGLLLSVPAGILADRCDRRLLMMLGDGCSGIGILFILLCMLRGDATLTEICVGVAISSVFSALLDPAYRATITDLLDEDEYSKAGGMVSLAGSARYLVSPLLAGILLAVSDIKLLLVIDICTFFVTVTATGVVRKGLAAKQTADRLAFADSTTLGIGETVCALGMLGTSLLLGARGIRKGYVKVLAESLCTAGAAMVFFGLKENIYLICASIHCLDYLVRTNIPDETQGRAWGLIGFLSQLGYVAAYASAGLMADGLAVRMGSSVGRGAAAVIKASGGLLVAAALLLYAVREVRELEKGGVYGTKNDSK